MVSRMGRCHLIFALLHSFRIIYKLFLILSINASTYTKDAQYLLSLNMVFNFLLLENIRSRWQQSVQMVTLLHTSSFSPQTSCNIPELASSLFSSFQSQLLFQRSASLLVINFIICNICFRFNFTDKKLSGRIFLKFFCCSWLRQNVATSDLSLKLLQTLTNLLSLVLIANIRSKMDTQCVRQSNYLPLCPILHTFMIFFRMFLFSHSIFCYFLF